MMPLKHIISELHRNKIVFDSLLTAVPSELCLYKPDKDHWCLLEIVCHLIDEEVEDFRARVKHTLFTPDLPLKSISPREWPIQRGYMDKDFETSVKNFLDERSASILWLRTLEDVPWENTVHLKGLGKLSARNFLENWLAHDYLHIRQINRVKRSYFHNCAQGDLSYAGNW